MKKLAALALVLLAIAGAVYLLRGDGELPQRVAAWMEREELAWLKQARGWFDEATASPTPVQYVTAAVERGAVRETVTATGSLQASVTVEVGSQLSGQIAELFVDFNNEVARGQPLARLDTRTLEARLAEARAAVEMAKAQVRIQRVQLERARVDVLDAEAQRAVHEARLDSARVRLEVAEGAVGRTVTLLERDVRTPIHLEAAEAERDQAAASLREVEAVAAAHEHAVDAARVGLRRAQAELDSALASIPQKEAAERAAEIDLERATIRSPVDGVVVGRNIDQGQTVAASLEAPTLFTIAGSLKQMEIHARVDEADIGKIAVRQPASFTVDAHPGRRFDAVVKGVRKAPQVVQNVVTYTVVLETENTEDLLMPGMTATVRITVQESTPGLKLPMAALRFSPSQETGRSPASGEAIGEGYPAAVWRMARNGRIEPVAVGVGSDDGAYAAVLSGPLAEGDEIVVGEVIEEAPARLFGIRVGF